jgi:hypothetical protein
MDQISFRETTGRSDTKEIHPRFMEFESLLPLS